MIMKFLRLILICGVIPLFAGMVLERENKRMAYVYGFMILLGIYEIIAIPTIFMNAPFRVLTYIWCLGIGIFAVLGIILKRKSIFKLEKMKLCADKSVYIYICLCLIQIVIVVLSCHYDADDSYFIGIANTALSTDSMFQYDAYTGMPTDSFPLRYVFSPFPLFWGSISFITGVHPAVLTHTVSPIFLISIVYLVIYELSNSIFDNKKKRNLFCILIAILNIFGNYSVYTTSSFLLFRIWQGKAIVANIILPLLILWFIKEEKRDIKALGILIIIILAGCGVSSMGIILQLLCLFSYGVILLVRRKWVWALQIVLAAMPCLGLSIAYIITSGR